MERVSSSASVETRGWCESESHREAGALLWCHVSGCQRNLRRQMLPVVREAAQVVQAVGYLYSCAGGDGKPVCNL